MKLIKYSAVLAAMTGAASAQGLFNVNPNVMEAESSPLKYTAGVNFGYDSNVTVTSGAFKEDSTYLTGVLGANLVVRDPRTSYDINVNGTVSRYFDDVAALGSDDTKYSARLAFNLNHRISDRTRFVTRNFVNYGIDLDLAYGASVSRTLDEFLFASTDNAIGFRWTDRLATYTGVNYSALDYRTAATDVNDRNTFSVYNQFRFSMSNVTVLTAAYRYSTTDYGGATGRDATNQYITVGFENKLTPTSSLRGDFGVQLHDVDGGGDSSNPFISLAYSQSLTQQVKARAFARYSLEDTDTSFGGGQYEEKSTIRVGAAVDYRLSKQVVFTGGVNYVNADYSKGGALADGDWDLFNIYAGMTYELSNCSNFTVSYNFTNSDSTGGITRDYTQSRFQVGYNYSF